MEIPQGRLTVQTILDELTAFPHRGAATENEAKAAGLLQGYLTGMGAAVSKEPFETPKTYATIIYWLTGGLLMGLALIPVTGVAIGLVWYFVWLAWLYFNWRYSFAVKFPVQHTAYNVIGRWPPRQAGKNVRKIILMAHYDTAPVSLLYGPNRQANVRLLRISTLWLMLLAGSMALLEVVNIGLPYVSYARYGLMVYFAVQAIVSTIGYWREGFTNGANDNATGVAAALATADQLTQANLTNVDIEVVLTSAKEVGMLGAYYYVAAHRKKWKRAQTLVINFDALGDGTVTVVEETGTAEILQYDNAPTRLARQLLNTDAFRDRAQMGKWHTDDFDSVWFVRNKIPVLALCALDARGQIPRTNQPDDTLKLVSKTTLYTAIDLAEAVVRQWLSDLDEKLPESLVNS